MPSGLLVFFVVSALPCVLSQISLSLSAPSLIKPSQTMKLACKVTGVLITDGSKLHSINFVRQDSEHKLVFLAHLNYAQGSAYNPSFSSRISLSRDTNKNEVYLEVRALEKEDTATYFCAAQRAVADTGAMDIWSPGTMVTVTSASQQAPSLFPLISCGKSQESTTTIACLARDYLPSSLDFSWNDKSNNSFTNGFKAYNPVLQSSGTYISSSQVKVSKDSWSNHDTYYCVAKHSENTKVVAVRNPETPKSTAVPVVTMHAPVKDDLNFYKNGTIMCLISAYYPSEINVKWRKNHVDTTVNTKTDEPNVDANGLSTIITYITVSKIDWDEDAVYSCVVNHPASAFSESRNLSKSLACEATAVPGVIQVSVVPPSFETIFLYKKAPLTCIISNMMTVDGLDASWYELGSETRLETILDNPVYQDSTYSIKATATVCADDWLEKKFECRVRHPDLTSPKKEILAKDNSQEPQTPTVLLFPPHQDELIKKESVTITCLAKGFFPEDIFVKWLKNDQVEDRNIVTTEPMEEPNSSGKKSYFLVSTFTVSFEDWNSGKTFTCLVGHESLPLQATQKTIDKTTGKPTSVNVSLFMSDSY